MNHRLRLRRLSRAMSIFTVLIGLAALALFAAYWLAPHLEGRLARDNLAGSVTEAIAPAGVAAAFIVSGLMLVVAEWGAWSAFRLFRAWSRGEPQPPVAGRHVRNMGAALIAFAVIKVAGGVVVSIAMTLDRVPGTRELTVSVGLENLVIVLTGVVLAAIGLALADAAAIADENRQFV
jgi:hypothetical protein